MPSWMAGSRSVRSEARHNERVKAYFRKHPERLRAARHRSYAQQVKLYGGDPSMKWESRLKWLSAKEAQSRLLKSAAKIKGGK